MDGSKKSKEVKLQKRIRWLHGRKMDELGEKDEVIKKKMCGNL